MLEAVVRGIGQDPGEGRKFLEGGESKGHILLA